MSFCTASRYTAAGHPLRHATPCRAMPCHAMPRHALPRQAVPYRSIPRLANACHTVPHHDTPCCALSCHTVPPHGTPCHAHVPAPPRRHAPSPDLGRVGFAISDRGHNYIRSSRASSPRRTRLWRRLLCHRRCRRSRRRANPRSRRSARPCVCTSAHARARACALVRDCAMPIATVECKAKVRAYFLEVLMFSAGWLQFG